VLMLVVVGVVFILQVEQQVQLQQAVEQVL
jgi:hypothetical protein